MSTDNKKLYDKASSLLEDLKKTFGDLFKEYKNKKEEFKNQPDKLGEFLSSDDWRNKFRIGTKNDEQWCKFFNFVRKTYKKVHDKNWTDNAAKADEANKCSEEVGAFCHLEKFQEQYKKVFDEWLKLDQQDKENKAGKISVDLDDQWRNLGKQISDIGIDKDLGKNEMENLALENPNFDTMLKFCNQVNQLLGINLDKYLFRNFDGFVAQFKKVFKEFKEAGCLNLAKWPKKANSKDINQSKKGKKEKEEKSAEYWESKISDIKHTVKKIEVRQLVDDEWRDFLWDNRMNFTHEQVRQLGFISDKDGYTDRFTLHRLADFVCFVPKSNYPGYDVVHDLRFFSLYMERYYGWHKDEIEQLFKYSLDINVNKNLQIKDGTPVEYLFEYDVELLMKDIDKLEHGKKFDSNYYGELVRATHDKLVMCLCAIKPEELVNTVLSENSYVPNSAKDVYKEIDIRKEFNNMFGCYKKWSNECCDYDYLCENLYGRIKDIIGIQTKDKRKKAIEEFVNSMSGKIFNFSKRNRESYLKQNKSSENINIEYETNRYALWSFYKIIIEITDRAEKEKEEEEKAKKQKKKVISKFKDEWLAKFNSVLKIKDDEKISNQQLEEFMKFMYEAANGTRMYLNELNLTQSFAEQIDDDSEFKGDAIPSVRLIESFLNDVFDFEIAYLKNSKTDVPENWKFSCAYKIINKLPKGWFSNRDNLISLLGYTKDRGNAELLDNKFDGHFSELNTGFGFFGFSKEQKESILDKIGEIRDECVFYAFISECIVYEGKKEKEVDVETLQMIIEKTEIYGLGLRCIDKYESTTIDDKIYDRMKKIVELINESSLKSKIKEQVFKNISDLYFNKLYYSNRARYAGELFGVELDKNIYESPKNKPTKADIICKAMREDKIDKDWFCEFLENSIELAYCDNDKVNISTFNVKEALYADREDIVDILLDPDKLEFCKTKYKELKPNGTAFNSLDTIENAIKTLDKGSCELYCQKFYGQNKKYFKEVKTKVLAGEALNISEDKKGIIESIKIQVVKHGLCWFSSWSKKFECFFHFKPADYFWLFDKETQKNLLQGVCTKILTKIDERDNSADKDKIYLDNEDGGFGKLLSLAEQSGNLSVFLENDLAIKLFDKMHDQFNDFEFEFCQKMLSVDKEDKFLQHILTSKRIYSGKESKDKRLPIYRFLISNDRKDIKSLKKQSDDAYDKYSEAYDDWEQKNDELKKQEQEEDKKTKNIEQMKSEVDEANKKEEELYEAYEVIDNKLKAMKRTLTEDDKNKLNTIAKDLLTNIRKNGDENEDKYTGWLDSSYRLLFNLLNKLEIAVTVKEKNTKRNFFDLNLEGTKSFRYCISALCAIEETKTEFDKTVIRDLFIEFIDFYGNALLDNMLQKGKIGDKTLKQLEEVLKPLEDFYNSGIGFLHQGLSQSQSNEVIAIFVGFLDRIKDSDAGAFLKLTRNVQLEELIKSEKCKLDTDLVNRIKKLFDKNQENPKVMTDTTEIKDNVINENNKQGNQNIMEDINKKDENDNMQFQEPNESSEGNNDSSNEKRLEKKSESENKLELEQHYKMIANIKRKLRQQQKKEFGLQNEKNDDKDSDEDSINNNKNDVNEETEFIKNEMLQDVNESNEDSNIRNDRTEDNTNQNLNANPQDKSNDNSSSNMDNKLSTKFIKKNTMPQSGTAQITKPDSEQFSNNSRNSSTNASVSNSCTTIATSMQNQNIPPNNVIEMLNNKLIIKETAGNSNTSQKMGYTAPAGSTAVSIALWLIFVFAQAELLLIAAIIFTVISLFLWGRKFYTDKIKKEGPSDVSSPQKNPDETSIDNNFLQQYQNMEENEKTIKQEQNEQNERNEMEK